MVDIERLDEIRRLVADRSVHAIESNLLRTLLHAGLVAHGLERHAAPARIAHRALGEVAAGWSGRSSGASADISPAAVRRCRRVASRCRAPMPWPNRSLPPARPFQRPSSTLVCRACFLRSLSIGLIATGLLVAPWR